jgi:hypothetical protein
VTRLLLALLSFVAMAQQQSYFVPVTNCRIFDTRSNTATFGGMMQAKETRSFPLLSGPCSLPANAVAWTLNITVIPQPNLLYATVWPTGQPLPTASLLNANFLNGKGGLANGTAVKAGTNGAISIYVSDATHVFADVSGYYLPWSSVTETFTAATSTAFTLSFPPITSPLVFVNGLRQTPPDYTITGQSIVFTAKAAPKTGDIVTVDYSH